MAWLFREVEMRLMVKPVPSGHDPPGKETEAEFSVLAAPVDCSWMSVTGALERKPCCQLASIPFIVIESR
jgi:hypothetical protein